MEDEDWFSFASESNYQLLLNRSEEKEPGASPGAVGERQRREARECTEE